MVYQRQAFHNATSRPVWTFQYHNCTLGGDYFFPQCEQSLVFNDDVCFHANSSSLADVKFRVGLTEGRFELFTALLLAQGAFLTGAAKSVSPQLNCARNQTALSWSVKDPFTNRGFNLFNACFDAQGRPTKVIDGSPRGNNFFTENVSIGDQPPFSFRKPLYCP